MNSSGLFPAGALRRKSSAAAMSRQRPRPSWPATPADEQGIAAGLLVEGATVGVAGLAEPREVAPKLGEEGAGGLPVEPVEPDDDSAVIRAPAAGDDGAGTAREAVEEGEELVAVGLREGLEVIEHEQYVGITGGAQDELGAFTFRRFRKVRLPQFARDGIEHLQIGRHHEVAERLLAVGGKLALL